MPWPISAGVLGMARTTRSLPVAATIAALRMPAITLSCSAPATKAAQGAAASAKDCGLTAQTTSCAAGQRGARRVVHADAELPRQRLALRLEGFDHLDRRRGAAGLEQAADDGAGHVAAADECNAGRVHPASVASRCAPAARTSYTARPAPA